MQKPNNKLYLMNYIFNEILDHVSKNNLAFCSLQFTEDLFTNKAQLDTGF